MGRVSPCQVIAESAPNWYPSTFFSIPDQGVPGGVISEVVCQGAVKVSVPISVLIPCVRPFLLNFRTGKVPSFHHVELMGRLCRQAIRVFRSATRLVHPRRVAPIRGLIRPRRRQRK